MDGDLADARKAFTSLTVTFRKRSELNRRACLCQIPRKGVILLLGNISLIPSTVSMKPSSYLKVTVNMSLIITVWINRVRRSPILLVVS